MQQSATTNLRRIVKECAYIPRIQFPLKYLGFPIMHSRKRKRHYVNIIRKVRDNLQACKVNMLSFGGNKVLISIVLQSIPSHTLSAILLLIVF